VVEEPVNVEIPATEVTTETPPVPDINLPPAETVPAVTPELNFETLPTEAQVKLFNKITGLNVSTIDDARKYAEVYEKLPNYKKNIDLFPILLEKLKASQDIMSYFPDEKSYKVAQLSKNENYKGKEAELSKLLHSDVTTMPAMEIVKLYSMFNTPEGVKNPFRYTIRQLGLDPDEVINNFDQLNEDDQDLFFGFAEKQRKELAKIGSDIEIPRSAMSEIEETLEAQLKTSKDDLEAKKSQLIPLTRSVVEDIRELKVFDDFNFKVEMSEDDKQGYSEFMTQAIMSGEFDISTDEGKKEIYEAVIDEIWVDNRQKIVKAIETHLRNKFEKEFRKEYDNEVPLGGNAPKPVQGENKKTVFVDIIEQMINERQ